MVNYSHVLLHRCSRISFTIHADVDVGNTPLMLQRTITRFYENHDILVCSANQRHVAQQSHGKWIGQDGNDVDIGILGCIKKI